MPCCPLAGHKKFDKRKNETEGETLHARCVIGLTVWPPGRTSRVWQLLLSPCIYRPEYWRDYKWNIKGSESQVWYSCFYSKHCLIAKLFFCKKRTKYKICYIFSLCNFIQMMKLTIIIRILMNWKETKINVSSWCSKIVESLTLPYNNNITRVMIIN